MVITKIICDRCLNDISHGEALNHSVDIHTVGQGIRDTHLVLCKECYDDLLAAFKTTRGTGLEQSIFPVRDWRK